MARKKKNTKKNTLICSVPGLYQHLEIPFQSRKLPVCKKCKKIYKTRELCRVRDGHTTLPWNTTYICFLVDDSCIEDGKLVQNEGDSFVAETVLDGEPPFPYVACLDKLGPNPPICLNCKNKNYTRYHCRTNHCHQQLPWVTTYVNLKRISEKGETPEDEADASEAVTSPVRSLEGSGVVTVDGSPSAETIATVGTLPSLHCASTEDDSTIETRVDREESTRPRKRAKQEEKDQLLLPLPIEETEEDAFPEDINRIAESKAFVLVIHEGVPSIHWLRTKPAVKVTDTYAHNSAPSMMGRNDSSLLYQNSTMLNDSLKIPHHDYGGAQSPQHRHHGHSWRNHTSPLMPQSWRDGQHMEPPPSEYPPHGYSQSRHYDRHDRHGGHHGSFYPPRHQPPTDYRYGSSGMMENPDAYDPYHSSHYGNNDQYSGRSMNSQQEHPQNYYPQSTRSRSMSDNYQQAYGHGHGHRHGPDSSAQEYHQNVPQGGSWAYDEINKASSSERCDFDTYVRDGPITERIERSHHSQPNHPADNRRSSPAFPGDMWNQCASIEPEKSITHTESNHLWPASASIDGDPFLGGGENAKDTRFSRNSENDGNFDGLSSGKVSPV